MAKIIVRAKRPLQLGMGPNAPKLNVGKNEIEESLIDKGVWYVKALLASGAITIEKAPEPPAPETLAEVVISRNKIDVIPPSIQLDNPPESVVETVKTDEPVNVKPSKKKAVAPKVEKPKIKREV